MPSLPELNRLPNSVTLRRHTARNSKRIDLVRSLTRLAVALVISLASAMNSWGQWADEGLAPGLVATLTDANGKTSTRVVNQLAVDLRLGTPYEMPTQASIEQIEWTGLWLPDGRGEYRFRLAGEGKFRLTLGDEVILDATCSTGESILSRPVTLSGDWQEIQLTAHFTNQNGWLKINKSSPRFREEPLAPQSLAHEDTTPWTQIEQGRSLAQTARCAACHTNNSLVTPAPAPRLLAQRSLPAREWLTDWLAKHSTQIESTDEQSQTFGSSKMPSFALSRQDIADLVAFLEQTNTTHSSRSALDDEQDTASGQALVLSRGCLACHAISTDDHASLAGPPLLNTGNKRSKAEWARWLTDPTSIAADATMAPVPLTEKERGQIADYLASRRLAPVVDDQVIGDSSRGAATYTRLNCGSCHGDHESNSARVAPPNLSDAIADNSCISQTPGNQQPRFKFTPDDEATIRAFLTSAFHPTSSTEPADTENNKSRPPVADAHVDGARLIKDLNCLACHARSEQPGLEPRLEQAAELIDFHKLDPTRIQPPALHGIGDKLTDEAWDHLLGEGLQRREWLTVRMPKYQLSQQERDAIRDYFRSQDMMIPQAEVPPVHVTATQAETSGGRLVTADGFGCVSCHTVGSRIPASQAPHNLGPSLSGIDRWLRRPWFDRWVRAPARIIPRMEMPSVQIPVQGVLNDDLDQQLAAVWQAVNRPDFEPPRPNPVRVVRQTGTTPDAPAIVLTDVFRMPDGPLIKPFVIALNNRHNVTFDLSAGELSHWWIGDAGREHTEGKTWFWEPGGPSVLNGIARQGEWRLKIEGVWRTPAMRGQFATEATSWRHVDAGIEVTMPLTFRGEVAERTLSIHQTFLPLNGNEPTSGFRRTIRFEGLQKDETIQIPVRAMLDTHAGSQADRHGITAPDSSIPWSLRIVSPQAVWDEDQASYTVRASQTGDLELQLDYTIPIQVDPFHPVALPASESSTEAAADIDADPVVPGFRAQRLPLTEDWMPTGLAWAPNGDLFLSSLKGRVWRLQDTDGDSLEDSATAIGDELAAPFGLYATDDYVDVINKYALLRLQDADGDGEYESTTTLASGWGHTADYHDWAVGLPRDSQGNYWIAIACQQDSRSLPASRHRGEVLRLKPPTKTDASPESQRYHMQTVSGGHRFPIGVTLIDDEVFVTDNQGNYNPFNELNHVRSGKRYGFLNAWEKQAGLTYELTEPAINIPHPWTRSVNGICVFAPNDSSNHPFAGHLIGCEYDTRRLVRMSLESVEGVYQGAVYPFSLEAEPAQQALLGPLTCAMSPRGELYIGGIRDSGWGGANNIGTLIRLEPLANQPCGIAEVQIQPHGFRVTLASPADPDRLSNVANYHLESYRRISTPQYGGPDVDRRREGMRIKVVEPNVVDLILDQPLRPGFVYELRLDSLVDEDQVFFPAEAFYSVNRIPE